MSMPVDGAAALGLNLGDVICLAASRANGASAGGTWCARLIGLWRRVAPGDAFWRGRPAMEVFTDRPDLLALVAALPGTTATVGRWYVPRPGAITAASAADLSERLHALSGAVTRQGGEAFRDDLTASLTSYAAAGWMVTFDTWLLTAALLVEAVLLAAVVTASYLGVRRAELAGLRSWGWPAGRVRGLVAIELGSALLGGVLGAALAAGAAAAVWPAVAHPSAAAVPAGALLGLAVCLGVLAARSLRRLDTGAARRRPAAPIVVVYVLLAGLAILPLALSGRLSLAQLPLPALPPEARVLPALAVLALLSGVALAILPPLAAGFARLWPGAAGALAGWRVGGWWRRHPAAGVLLVFASAVAGFSIFGAAGLRGPAGPFDPLLLGLIAVLAAALAASGLVVLVAGGALARAAARSQGPEDAALRFDGVPAGVLRGARGLELRLVLGLSVLVGGGAGVLVAWAAAWRVL
jgi:hypothetical protein